MLVFAGYLQNQMSLIPTNPKTRRIYEKLQEPKLSPLDLVQPDARAKLTKDHVLDLLLAQIETACAYHRLSDRELCRRSGLTQTYMHSLRNERQLPNVQTLCQLASALDYSLIIQFSDFKTLLGIVNEIHLFNPLVLPWRETYSPGELQGMREERDKAELARRAVGESGEGV